MKRSPLGELRDAEPLTPLDDDVQPAVVERLEVDHVSERADVPNAVLLVGEHQTERLVALEALADQLAIAKLEDVQRDLLRREQRNPEREEPDLRHG